MQSKEILKIGAVSALALATSQLPLSDQTEYEPVRSTPVLDQNAVIPESTRLRLPKGFLEKF